VAGHHASSRPVTGPVPAQQKDLPAVNQEQVHRDTRKRGSSEYSYGGVRGTLQRVVYTGYD
jgi:hypothetical protein